MGEILKITLPTILPTLLVAIIYTIIDSFTDVGNGVMQMITEKLQARQIRQRVGHRYGVFRGDHAHCRRRQHFPLSKRINYAAD